MREVARRKKIPVRLCLSCRSRQEKKAMIRIIRTPEGKIEIDPTGKKSGRGTYVCPDTACIEKITQKTLSSALKSTLGKTEVKNLQEELLRVTNFKREEVEYGKDSDI